MEPRISLVTLGVEDVGRSRRFYEVDDVVAAAEAAGAPVTRAPGPTFYGGYAAYFRDPDGHVWEIAFNSGFTLDDDGALKLPVFGREGDRRRADAGP